VTRHFMASCLTVSPVLDQVGIKHDYDLGWNESLVHRARMEMARKFLAESDFTHLMWWDADIEAVPDDLAKLWNLDADIAVGVYTMKKPDKCWYAAWVNGALVKDLDQYTKPIEVDFAGTGFMLIKREALVKIHLHITVKHEIAKRMIARLGDLPPDEAKIAKEMLDGMSPVYQGPDGDTPALFTTPIFNGGLESEDYHFCRIARDAGFKIIMDPSVRLTHWGQYPYGPKVHVAG
jgi:hypothetical protein